MGAGRRGDRHRCQGVHPGHVRGVHHAPRRAAHHLSAHSITMKAIRLYSTIGLLAALCGGFAGPNSATQPATGFAEMPAAVKGTDSPVSVTMTNHVDAELLRPASEPFTLGPGDSIEIEIVGQPITRAITAVGPDGKIYFYLLPGLDVWGLTLDQTREH